jgi:hypothetical protein
VGREEQTNATRDHSNITGTFVALCGDSPSGARVWRSVKDNDFEQIDSFIDAERMWQDSKVADAEDAELLRSFGIEATLPSRSVYYTQELDAELEDDSRRLEELTGEN